MAVGPIVVIKVGGEVVAGPAVRVLGADVATLVAGGTRVVLVHGGGPQATDLQQRLGLETRQIAGRRVTDAATLDVMKMTVAGRVNVDLCAALLAAGVRPVGLHGASARVVAAVRRPPKVMTGAGPDPVDLGLVGDVVGFDLALLELLLGAGYVPVVACLGADRGGQVYNINADVVGNQLGAALRADHLFLLTSTPGVLRDAKDPATRIPRLTAHEARAAIADGVITGGMIPKVEEALAVLDLGVGAIHILGQLAPGDLAREAREPGSVGTVLLREAP